MTNGMKTSEFYVTVLMMVAGILNKVFGWGLNVEEFALAMSPGAAYVVSRGIAKVNAK